MFPKCFYFLMNLMSEYCEWRDNCWTNTIVLANHFKGHMHFTYFCALILKFQSQCTNIWIWMHIDEYDFPAHHKNTFPSWTVNEMMRKSEVNISSLFSFCFIRKILFYNYYLLAITCSKKKWFNVQYVH